MLAREMVYVRPSPTRPAFNSEGMWKGEREREREGSMEGEVKRREKEREDIVNDSIIYHSYALLSVCAYISTGRN